MVNKIVLPNGIRILLEKMESVHSATVSIWIDTSYQHQTPVLPGLAHFVEHMLFKGTQHRNTTDIVQAIEDYGGAINAITDKESTCYYARVLSDQVPLAIDVLSDMILSPLLEPDEVELERQVILQEILVSEDSAASRVLELFVKSAWPNHLLGAPVIGFESAIKSITRQHILDYLAAYYIPQNMVVSIAGEFEPEAVLKQLTGLFGHLSAQVVEQTLTLPQYQPQRVHDCKETEQVHLCIGTQGLPANADNRFMLGVLDVALGGGMSSRLFQELREQQGLVYSINTFEVMYRKVGLFGVYAGTSADKLETVIQSIETIFDRLVCDGLPEAELNRAKQKIQGNLKLNMESTRYRATRNARSEMYLGHQLTIQQVCQAVNQVTQSDIKALAENLLAPERLSYALAGPANLALPQLV